MDELREKIAPQLLRRTKADVAKDLPRKIIVESMSLFIAIVILSARLYAQAVELFRRQTLSPQCVSFQEQPRLAPVPAANLTEPKAAWSGGCYRPEPLTDYRGRATKARLAPHNAGENSDRKETKSSSSASSATSSACSGRYIVEALNVSPDIINGDTASAPHTTAAGKTHKAFQDKPGFGVIILFAAEQLVSGSTFGANHVMHYTRTWNPAKEDQATDRAYRLANQGRVSSTTR